MGDYEDRFMLHYNMPPFATGETGRVGSPSAAKSATAVWPSAPGARAAHQGRVPLHHACGVRNHRVQRLVVDGFGLRRLPGLMDAGVPMKAHVAGIAMGLIKDGNRSPC
jgi:polyribonucleotide nucleotidyltransferase